MRFILLCTDPWTSMSYCFSVFHGLLWQVLILILLHQLHCSLTYKKRMRFHPYHQFNLRSKHVFCSEHKHINPTAQPLLALKSCHRIFSTLLTHNTVIHITSLVTRRPFLCFSDSSARIFSSVTEIPVFEPIKCFSVWIYCFNSSSLFSAAFCSVTWNFHSTVCCFLLNILLLLI